MTVSNPRPRGAVDSSDTARSDDPSLETLRAILFDRYRQQIAELEAELDDIERQINDKERLTAIITPIMGDAIRRRIRDARDEMIETLYPIIGQTVVRAVSEAIRDLARNVDAQMRKSLSPRAIWYRVQARVSGVSRAEIALRESLPFSVDEVFLIHRETGLLLWYISHDLETSFDSEIISGMLTAIRDFVQDAFGRSEEGQLDEIQYGDRRVLIEATQLAYLAVVVDGIEPPGFRAEMREQIIEISHVYEEMLRDYNGDNTPLTSVDASLRALAVASAEPRELSPAQKRVLTMMLGLATMCLATICLGSRWAWQTSRISPTPSPTITPTATFAATPSPVPTATPSPTLTATPPPTPTATPAPTATPTATSKPTPTPTPAPVLGVMIGNVWSHEGPSFTAPRTGLILEQGQPVEILAVLDEWCLVHWVTLRYGEHTGWVQARWVGIATTIPARIVTPTPGP